MTIVTEAASPRVPTYHHHSQYLRGDLRYRNLEKLRNFLHLQCEVWKIQSVVTNISGRISAHSIKAVLEK